MAQFLHRVCAFLYSFISPGNYLLHIVTKSNIYSIIALSNQYRGNMKKKLQVVLTDSKGQTETFIASVQSDETKFSAKELRKALQIHVIRVITLDVKHGVNRGCKIGINVLFDDLNTTLHPIYFGGYTPGERADKSLKAQLAVLVVDIKELISAKDYQLPQSVIDKRAADKKVRAAKKAVKA